MTPDVCPRCGKKQTVTAYCVDARNTPTYADQYGCARYESHHILYGKGTQ